MPNMVDRRIAVNFVVDLGMLGTDRAEYLRLLNSAWRESSSGTDAA